MRTRAPAALAIVFLLVLAGGSETGAAASLPATSARLAAGTGVVSPCDGDGFAFHHVIDTSGRITTVSVVGIDAACAGGTLRLTLTNGTTSVGGGSANLPSVAFGGTIDVTISPQPLSSGVSAVYASLEGP